MATAREGHGPTFLHATCVRPEGHFLGDPLLRIVRKPVRELKSKVGPLVKAATTSARLITPCNLPSESTTGRRLTP